MGLCPFCRSDYIFFSKKRGSYLCEDCGKSFDAPLTQQRAMRLFFSYGHDKNAPLVEAIKTELEKRGHQVWIDTSRIKKGNDWREAITKGILDSDRVISFMSKHSVRRPGVCLDELRIALCVRGADIRTILLEREGEVTPPASLSSRQWLDLSGWEERYAQGGPAWEAWLAEMTQQLCQSIESDEAITFAGEIGRLQQILSPVVYDARELNLVNRQFEGRDWLMKALEQWRQDPNGNQFFCIYGVPGAGKSTFLANMMHYDPDVLAAVFFEWDETRRDSSEAVVRSLAFQIAAKLPDYRKQLLYVLDRTSHLETYNAGELFRLLLTDPLNNCIDGGRQGGLIVLDALDEAAPGVVPFLLEKLQALPRWLRVLVTSRDEPFVHALLPDAKQMLLDADQQDNNRDIGNYISGRLPQLSLKVVNDVIRRAEGSFLYAVFFCDSVLTGDIDPDNLQDMPAGLGRFYAQNFLRIFRDPVEFEIMMPMLSLLACRDAIPREVVCGALELDQPQYMALRRKLGAFVRVSRVTYRYSKEAQYMLKFSHKSLRDWLEDPERSDGFCLDLKVGRRLLAQYALTRVRQNRRWRKKPMHYVGECPKIDLDLELDYLQSNLGRFLADAGMFRELEEFLLEEDTPWIPYWRELRLFPEGYSMNRLLERLEDGFDRVNDQLRRCERKNTPRYIQLFEVVADSLGQPGVAELLFHQLRERRLDAYFRSAASDAYDYNGLTYQFNADKIDIATAVIRGIRRCRELGVRVPEDVAQMVERLKLSSMFCEGKCGHVETIYGNFFYLFRDSICILDDEVVCQEFNFKEVARIRREYNTICLQEYLERSFGNDAYVDDLIQAGADLNKAADRAINNLERECKPHGTGVLWVLVNTTMGAAMSKLNYIEQVRNRYAPRRRWHPEPADHIRNMGAMFDYCELYRFPCCGKTVVTGDGEPSQFRFDGCQECE